MNSKKLIKVIPQIFGGLGNQLFIYASARRLALVNNAELVLNDVSGFVRDYTYQRQYQLDHFHIPCRKATAAERLEPFSRVRRNLKHRVNRYISFEKRSYIKQDSLDFEPRLLKVKPYRNLYLEGYWQSEDYFKDVEDVIRQDLRIHPPDDEKNQAMAKSILSHTAVAIHVRFFDGPEENSVHNAPNDYYRCAIAEIEKRVPNAHYYLFSDNAKESRKRIPLADNRITVVAHNIGETNAYADLWLMTQCQHFIIANSTFSWWGAWLANQRSKTVISPGAMVGRETAWGFNGLIPTSWIVFHV
ncbi:alpha-1,2-fucosyltransferase [Leptolyngbya sp. KIOST-1]|uniref:alpha-1,2-fucosyltransferase n=1 Tax=Leptolyngbya sp. KIOST-1 TaxID=1229172 RepID=UPI0018CDB45C|nr:alpha-1,2-fucosyltransferase [Leptolyngbya sp. KIOST-1]